jgi:hypothetical protein
MTLAPFLQPLKTSSSEFSVASVSKSASFALRFISSRTRISHRVPLPACHKDFLFFSTMMHIFAQTFSPISIDVENNRAYLAHRLNRKHKDFTVRFRPRDSLTVVAILIGTGKFKGFPVQPKRSKSLTAIAASG